jgi:hypothetical protein
MTTPAPPPCLCADFSFLLVVVLQFAWSDEQKEQCEVAAPTVYHAIQYWTIMIYVTYGTRLLLFLADKYAQRNSASLPHVVTISTRSLLSVINGGFSCAGPLDKNQPANQLDLMLIPTITYRPGMYAEDDAVCGVCQSTARQGGTHQSRGCAVDGDGAA